MRHLIRSIRVWVASMDSMDSMDSMVTQETFLILGKTIAESVVEPKARSYPND